MCPPLLPLECTGTKAHLLWGHLSVWEQFFLGRGGQSKDAPSPSTRFLLRSHAVVQVSSPVSSCTKGGNQDGRREKGAGREQETGAGDEVLRLSEHFSHFFFQDHGNWEFPVINRVPVAELASGLFSPVDSG